MSTVIVGSSVAGIRTAQALRSRGYTATVTVIGEELHRPYDKPTLSQEMLLPDRSSDPVPLLDDEQLAALEADLRLGAQATCGGRQPATVDEVPQSDRPSHNVDTDRTRLSQLKVGAVSDVKVSMIDRRSWAWRLPKKA